MNLGKLSTVFRSLLSVAALAGPAAFVLMGSGTGREKVRQVVKEYTAIDMTTGQFRGELTYGGIIPRGWMPSIGLELAQGLVSLVRSVF